MKFIEVLLVWVILLGLTIVRDNLGLEVRDAVIVVLIFLAFGATAHYLWTVYVEVVTARAILEAL